MGNNFLNWIIWPIAGCLLMGCASVNFNTRVDKKLDTEYLNEKLGTEKIDLSIDGMCPGTLPLKVVNVETRDERYVIYDVMGVTWYLIPNGFTDHVARYIAEKLIESKLTIDKESGKEIDVSMQEVKAEGNWSLEATSKFEIHIPEINYTRIYSGVEGSGMGDYAVAYSVHLAVMKFLNDPVFQKYVQCR
jgi:hypothetical protein